MFQRLVEIVAGLTGGTASAPFAADDYRLAAAVLLVHVGLVDGVLAESEKARLTAILAADFELDEPTTRRLIDAAVAAELEEGDITRFARVLTRTLEPADRLRIVSQMWYLARADGAADELEETAVETIARFLGLDAEAARNAMT